MSPTYESVGNVALLPAKRLVAALVLVELLLVRFCEMFEVEVSQRVLVMKLQLGFTSKLFLDDFLYFSFCVSLENHRRRVEYKRTLNDICMHVCVYLCV